MMVCLTLLIAIFSLVIAHYFKVYRLKQLIQIYEKPDSNNLIQALSFGYILNFIFPFKFGDFFRAWFSGRKMKNGFTFSIATIIVDRILDIFVVSIIFLVIYLLGYNDINVILSLRFYFVFSILLLVFFIFNYNYSKFLKIIIMKISSIFNNNIELRILKFSWYIITSFKDLILNISKRKMLFNTVVMWGAYIISYLFFSISM